MTTQLEDNVAVTPMLAVQWLPADKWIVRVGAVPVSGGATAGADVAYQFSE